MEVELTTANAVGVKRKKFSAGSTDSRYDSLILHKLASGRGSVTSWHSRMREAERLRGVFGA